MIIALTGTPGTGKSSVVSILAKETEYNIIDLHDVAKGEVLIGTEKGSKIVDIEKLSKKVKMLCVGRDIIVGHLSHLLGLADLTIVLRASPKVLEKRLREKGFPEKKIKENLEAEALDICLIESLERCKDVYEIDTTCKNQELVVKEVLNILKGEKDGYRPGEIDWSEEYF